MRLLGLVSILTACLLLEGIREELRIRSRKQALRTRAFHVVGYRGVK